jgi:hypothetical protein
MPETPAPRRLSPGFFTTTLVVMTVIMLCCSAGCTSFSVTKVMNFGSSDGDSAGGSGRAPAALRDLRACAYAG